MAKSVKWGSEERGHGDEGNLSHHNDGLEIDEANQSHRNDNVNRYCPTSCCSCQENPVAHEQVQSV